MLNENKTKRYLKYAFGEIVLVVIGILIALQVNTWNESRKAKIEEQKILKALHSDFKVSEGRIEKTLREQNDVIAHGRALINIHERENSEDYTYFDTHLDSLHNLIVYGTTWYRAEPVTGAYNALISAGKIDLIQNENLRHLLAQFAADLESGFEDQDSAMKLLSKLEDVTSNFILKITNDRYRNIFGYKPRTIDTLSISNPFFNNEIYFGILYKKLVYENNRIRRQKSLLKQTEAILEVIEGELK